LPASAVGDAAHVQPGKEQVAPNYTLAKLTLSQAGQFHGKRVRGLTQGQEAALAVSADSLP
jgi:hypothetical protein